MMFTQANLQSRLMLDITTAAKNGNLNKIEILFFDNTISTEILNTLNSEQQSALHLAAENGHKKVVSFLIEKGANVNIKGLGNTTPLHSAAYFGHAEIVEMLLDNGAEPHCKNADGDTPRDYATQEDHTEIVQLLESYLSENNISL